MSWPNANHFGINENPITVTPYFENNGSGGTFPENDFLLIADGVFLLLGGGNLLLLGAT